MLLPRYGMIVGPPPTRGGTAVPEGITSDVESAQDHLPDLRRRLPAASGVRGWNDRVPRMLEGSEHAKTNHPHNQGHRIKIGGLGNLMANSAFGVKLNLYGTSSASFHEICGRFKL